MLLSIYIPSTVGTVSLPPCVEGPLLRTCGGKLLTVRQCGQLGTISVCFLRSLPCLLSSSLLPVCSS